MFAGLSAFPLTPLRDDRLDEAAYARLIERLADAGVDSIGALGSTGAYPYLDLSERARAARVAVEHAGSVPVVVGVGALRTAHVLRAAEDAQRAGASGLLLAPVSYQPLTPDEVVGLYAEVSAAVSVPIVLYDNPRTTHVTFTDELYAEICALPHVSSIKIPGRPAPAIAERVQEIRGHVPADIALGVSGDAFGAAGLLAGCALWYSSIAGTLPGPLLTIARAALAGDPETALSASHRLAPLWELVATHGGMRVADAIARSLHLVEDTTLPRPLRGLEAADRARVDDLLSALAEEP